MTKRDRDEHEQDMEILYDSRIKEYMIKISSIRLRIQYVSKVTIVDCNDNTLSLPVIHATIDFVICGYVRGEFMTKNERDKHEQEMEIFYDLRSKECMIKISFIILKIQDFTEVTMLDHKDDTLSLPNSE